MKKALIENPNNTRFILLTDSMIDAVYGAFVEVMTQSEFPLGSLWTKHQFIKELNHNRVYGLVGQNEILAYLVLAEVGEELEIQQFVVQPKYWGKGVGKRLLELTFKRFWDKNFILEVHDSNTPAKNLYLKFGFKIEGLRKNYYGDGAHAVLMRKKPGST